MIPQAGDRMTPQYGIVTGRHLGIPWRSREDEDRYQVGATRDDRPTYRGRRVHTCRRGSRVVLVYDLAKEARRIFGDMLAPGEPMVLLDTGDGSEDDTPIGSVIDPARE